MRLKEEDLTVGTIIQFNSAASYHRTSYVFGRIVKVTKQRTLDIDVIKTVGIHNDRYTLVTIPDINETTHRARLNPKRTLDSEINEYRFEKNDVYIELYDPEKTYSETFYD